MSSFMAPSGPEPSMVYWIRRGALLLVALTLIIGAWWLFGALRGGDSTGSEPTASASVSAAASSSAAASPSATAPAEPVECADSEVAVTADTDAKSYAVGSTPNLSLTIENISDTACKRDVGPKANSIVITSGGYHVWSSDDCEPGTKSKIVVLKPGKVYGSSITWDGKLSQKGCPSGLGSAKPGRYEVVAVNGKVTSDPARFSLTKGN